MSTVSAASAPGLGHRWVGRAGTIGFVLAALALARAIGTQFPDPLDEFEQPHVVTAALGQTVELRTAEVTVQDVRVGTELVASGTPLPTEGVWVMAELSYTPTAEDTGLPYARIVDGDGRTFLATRGGTNTCGSSGPGIPLTCSVSIEIPADAAPGAVLQLASTGDHQRDTVRFDSLLELPLGLTAADVEAAQATGSSLEIPAPVPGRTP